MGLDRDFWQEKRVFLTGHTGFKGAWITLCLVNLGARVTGYSLDAPTEPNLFDIAHAQDCLYRDHRANILDFKTLQTAIAEAEPDIVLHMAAQSLVRASYHDPLLTYATNVTGTAHVLEVARHLPSIKAAVIVTSDKCYENREWNYPYRETDPLGGHDPYSASKACAELVTASYRASFTSATDAPLRIASARAGNVIGGGDWAADRLIPDCIRAFSHGQPLMLRYPEAVRPWQHVLEPLTGYLLLLENLLGHDGARFAAAWNFGPDSTAESTVRDVAVNAAQFWGDGAEVRIDRANVTHHEASLLRLDSTKARVELGWQPRWPLTRSVKETVRWYRAWHSGQDMHRFCMAQIDDYFWSAA